MQRHYFANKGLLVKSMVFPVVMYGCESWTVKKAELWCWRGLLRVPWTARRSNQSILKISPRISLEGMMLKLKLQYFGHLMRRVDSLEKTLMLGGIGGQEEKGTTEDEMAGWHHLRDGHESEWTPGVGDGQGGLACWDSWGCKESDMTEWLIWSDLILHKFLLKITDVLMTISIILRQIYANISYTIATLLLEFHPKEPSVFVHQNTSFKMFLTAYF